MKNKRSDLTLTTSMDHELMAGDIITVNGKLHMVVRVTSYTKMTLRKLGILRVMYVRIKWALSSLRRKIRKLFDN